MSEAALKNSAPPNGAPPRGTGPKSVPPVSQVEDLDVAALRFGLSPRKPAIDPDHVTALAGMYPQLPPILVHAASRRVIDGVHRVMAARALGRRTIPALLFVGSDHEAAILAVHRNVAHGKPLTLREREAAAAALLGSHPEWSDRRIAEVCGLSPKTAGRIRAQVCVDSPQLGRRVGRDGRARPADPADGRRRIAAAIESDPSASVREIAARTGAAEGTVRDVRSRLEEGRPPDAPARPRRAKRRPPGPPRATEDEAYRASEANAAFVEWLDRRVVTADDEWLPFVPAVPLGRVYEVADVARRCADTWTRLASAMEARADRRRAR